MKKSKIFLKIVLFVFFVSLCTIPSLYAQQEKNMDLFIQQGSLAFYQKNFKLAVEMFQKALDRITDAHSRYNDIYALLLISYDEWGTDHLQKGDLDNAVKYYNKELYLAESAEIDIDWSRIFNNTYISLALAYFYTDNYDLSIQTIQKASPMLESEKKPLEFSLLGRCYAALGDISQAELYLEKLHELDAKGLVQELQSAIMLAQKNVISN